MFMTPKVSARTEQFVILEGEDDNGPMFLSESPLGYNFNAGSYNRDDLMELRGKLENDDIRQLIKVFRDFPRAWEVEVTGPLYYGYLSAAGTFDRTEVVLGETQKEVAEQLLELYFSGDPEYMEDDEKEQIEWLEEMCKGGID